MTGLEKLIEYIEKCREEGETDLRQILTVSRMYADEEKSKLKYTLNTPEQKTNNDFSL